MKLQHEAIWDARLQRPQLKVYVSEAERCFSLMKAIFNVFPPFLIAQDENGRLNRRASSAHTQSQGRNISMTGELLYKSFHSSAGHFRGYGTILVTDEFITYSVMFKPEQVIKITLWNVLHVDCPTWVARQGFEVMGRASYEKKNRS